MSSLKFVSFPGNDFSEKTSLAKSHFHGRTGLHHVRRANHLALGCETNRISAIKNGQGADGVQRVGNTGKGLLRSLQTLMNGIRQPLFANFYAVRARSHKASRPPGLLETKRQIVHTLDHSPDSSFGNDESPASNL